MLASELTAPAVCACRRVRSSAGDGRRAAGDAPVRPAVVAAVAVVACAVAAAAPADTPALTPAAAVAVRGDGPLVAPADVGTASAAGAFGTARAGDGARFDEADAERGDGAVVPMRDLSCCLRYLDE